MILDAYLNALPLSEIILDGMPCLAVKHLKPLMKVEAVILVTRLRCTALVAQHVYKYNHVFEVPAVSDVLT